MSNLAFKRMKLPKFDLGGDIAKQDQRRQQTEQGTASAITAAGSFFGPVGSAVAGAYNLYDDILDNATKNDSGIYKSKGAQMVNYALNPLAGVQDVISGDIKQDHLKQQQEFMKAFESNESMQAGQAAGTKITNSLPTFQAPMYGRSGLKLRTRGLLRFKKPLYPRNPPLRGHNMP